MNTEKWCKLAQYK